MPGIGLGDFYARMLEIYFLIIRVDFLVKNVMLALQFIYVYVSIVANCDWYVIIVCLGFVSVLCCVVLIRPCVEREVNFINKYEYYVNTVFTNQQNNF